MEICDNTTNSSEIVDIVQVQGLKTLRVQYSIEMNGITEPECDSSSHDSQVFSSIGEKLYLKPDKADVYFCFESSDERIPAHKILLASGSVVFEAMFYGSLKEEGDIKIVDVSADVFKIFLRFFYSNKVEVSLENVTEIIYLAKKYDVDECLQVCSSMLADDLNIENLISTLSMAIAYGERELQERCESEIRANSKEILQSDSFLECDRDVLKHILNIGNFSCSITEVFEACMAWVRAVSKQNDLTKEIIQTHLGELFYEIEFTAMSLDAFLKLLPSYGHLFTGDEYNEILQVLSNQQIQPKIFKGERYEWNEDVAIDCDRTLSFLYDDNYFVQQLECTTFSTNFPLLLGGFICSPILHNDGSCRHTSVPIIVRLISYSTHIEAEFVDSLITGNLHKVQLPKPILIKPKIRYELQLSLPEDLFFTVRELKPCLEIETSVTLNFHDNRVQNGKIRGIIHGFRFNFTE